MRILSLKLQNYIVTIQKYSDLISNNFVSMHMLAYNLAYIFAIPHGGANCALLSITPWGYEIKLFVFII